MAWDESLATHVRRRVARHEEVAPEDLTRFETMLAEAIQEANGQDGEQVPAWLADAPDWTDKQAHEVYQRINQDPSSVTDEDAEGFARWTQLQQWRQTHPPAPGKPPGPDASIQERKAYLDAAAAHGLEPDPATADAFGEQVNAELAAATQERLAAFPPGMLDSRPTTPDPEELQGRMRDLWARAQAGEDVGAAAAQAVVDVEQLQQAATAQHQREALPWALPADQQGPGVEPGAVEALTAPAPWTPREPTETERAIEELGALDQQLEGDDAA